LLRLLLPLQRNSVCFKKLFRKPGSARCRLPPEPLRTTLPYAVPLGVRSRRRAVCVVLQKGRGAVTPRAAWLPGLLGTSALKSN